MAGRQRNRSNASGPHSRRRAALADALDARAQAVQAFGRVQAPTHPARTSPCRATTRSIARMVERVRIFPKDAVRPVMNEVLSACCRLIAPLEGRVRGPGGRLRPLWRRAALRQLRRCCARSTPRGRALSEVERGNASYAMLPFETSTRRRGHRNLNLLARSDVKVCAEIRIRRAFHLISTIAASATTSRRSTPRPAPSRHARATSNRSFPRAV